MFSPGFRLSAIDVAVLVAALTGSAFLSIQLPLAGFMLAFVVGHFFLFCNVFRISRAPELIWAAVFLSLTIATVWLEKTSFAFAFGGSFIVALVLIYRETQKPSYHGIGWQRLNPGLREWWERRGRESSRNT